jgi:hypothetical protein
VGGRLLNVAEGDSGVQRRGDERVTQRVGPDPLGDPGTTGDTTHDPPGCVSIEALPVSLDEDRTHDPLNDGHLDGPGDTWRQRHGGQLAALAHHGQGAMAALQPDRGDAYCDRIESLRELIERYDRQIEQCDTRINWRLKGDSRFEALQRIGGVGPVFAAIFVAEIGDVTRFPTPRHLCSWAGLTPRHRESDAHLHRGSITRQGSRLLRWAAVEAISGAHVEPRLRAVKNRVGQRRGRNIGRVAAARHLLTLVFYALRDGEIRCLATNAA